MSAAVLFGRNLRKSFLRNLRSRSGAREDVPSRNFLSRDHISDHRTVLASHPSSGGQTCRSACSVGGWTATPSGAATSVEFWIDGARRWVDTSGPFAYGETGILDLTSLSSGTHRFVVKATSTSGQTASTTI